MADVLAGSSATGQVVKAALIARRLFELDEKDAARAVIEPALEALRQAFDRVESDAASGRSHAHHPVAAAPHLLSVAEVIDPKAFEGWQQRTLGLPRRPAGFTPLRLEGLINAKACLAIALADRSPAIARAVIDPWVEALSLDGDRAIKARSQIEAISTALRASTAARFRTSSRSCLTTLAAAPCGSESGRLPGPSSPAASSSPPARFSPPHGGPAREFCRGVRPSRPRPSPPEPTMPIVLLLAAQVERPAYGHTGLWLGGWRQRESAPGSRKTPPHRCGAGALSRTVARVDHSVS